MKRTSPLKKKLKNAVVVARPVKKTTEVKKLEKEIERLKITIKKLQSATNSHIKRKESEEKTTKLFQDSLIDHLPNHYIFWKDRNSVYLGCNKALAAALGFKSSTEIIGKTDFDLPTTKEESEAYRADDCQVMRSKIPKSNIEEPQTLADGKKRILSTSKVPLFDEKGKVYGVLAIYSDITHQKLIEQDLLETNKKLEQTLKAKSEFVRNISHDIRTPLSGIQQATHLIAQGETAKEDIAEYAFAAWEASNELMALLNQIIDVSNKEAFDFEDKSVKFDLYQLVDALNKTYQAIAQNKGISLTINYSPKVPQYLIGKNMRLHRILLNLLGNALKFTEHGKVKLEIKATQQSKEKVTLQFSVIDTGIGIPKEKFGEIFEKFTRLHPSYQGQYPGCGLGLHVVKEYVEKLRGEIYVKSEIGHGSVFTCLVTFKCPRVADERPITETKYEDFFQAPLITTKKPTVTIPPSLEETGQAKYHILLVEDDPLMQTMGIAILKKMNHYRIDLAKSGEEALELTTTIPYDAIYLDIGLPGIDGIATAQKIRNNSKNLNQNTFIAALTAHSDEEIVSQCLSAGMQQTLIKPLTSEKIHQVHAQLDKLQPINANKSVIDWALWLTRLNHNYALAEESFHMLIEELFLKDQNLAAAYQTQDWSELKSMAHQIRGMLAYCGLPRLEKAISALESAARQNNLKKIHALYPDFTIALEEAQLAYQEWAKSHPKSAYVTLK